MSSGSPTYVHAQMCGKVDCNAARMHGLYNHSIIPYQVLQYFKNPILQSSNNAKDVHCRMKSHGREKALGIDVSIGSRFTPGRGRRINIKPRPVLCCQGTVVMDVAQRYNAKAEDLHRNCILPLTRVDRPEPTKNTRSLKSPPTVAIRMTLPV